MRDPLPTYPMYRSTSSVSTVFGKVGADNAQPQAVCLAAAFGQSLKSPACKKGGLMPSIGHRIAPRPRLEHGRLPGFSAQ